MPRKAKANVLSDDGDPGLVAVQAQKRIFQLRRKRDEQIASAVANAKKGFAYLGTKIVAHNETGRKARAKAQTERIKSLGEVLKRRKEVEKDMVELVKGMQRAMEQVEKAMLAGYKGRGEEIAKLVDKSAEPIHPFGESEGAVAKDRIRDLDGRARPKRTRRG